MDAQSHFSGSSFTGPVLPTGSPSVLSLSLPNGSSSGATPHARKIAQGRPKKRKKVPAQGGTYRPATTIIDMLPDNVLLEIFDFYRSQSFTRQGTYILYLAWPWHLLAHVCRRWRQIVFESPHRLDLQIVCTHRTPTNKDLGIWPAFPIVINYHQPERGKRPLGQGNIIAALKHPDRVCYVSLDIASSQLGKMATIMRKVFPVLTQLHIASRDRNAPVLSARFLGGSAPLLREFFLSGIPYPTLPTFLLSTNNLVRLSLCNIPPTGYLSPKVMVASLAALPKLRSLDIRFTSATPRPDRMHLPPITQTILPALAFFGFVGASEYLEDLVSRIDGPQLVQIAITYLNQLVDFQVTQLSRFINRSVGTKLNPFEHVRVGFYSTRVHFTCDRANHNMPFILNGIECEGIDWQVSHMAHVLSQVSALHSNVAHLKLTAELKEDRQLEGTDDVEWLYLLRQFSSVRTLHVSRKLARNIALALEDSTAEMATEVLPSLDSICIEGLPASSVEKFVTARRLSGRPVAVIGTYTELW